MRTIALTLLLFNVAVPSAAALRAGASQVDVSPTWFPVIVNCFMIERQANAVTSPILAKALVLENGPMKMAIVVVDSCMMPRELIDAAKALAEQATGIPASRQSISATHTHMAPAAMPCLGSDADARYAAWLPARIAQAIVEANSRLEPASAGSAVRDDYEHTFNRRFIYRPDKMLTDPFGEKSVRANMHPGYENPDAIGPSGPVDPALTLLSIRSLQGKPIAVLANYSMHYFDSKPISADYFGLFATQLATRLQAPPGFVVLLSQGTSGDSMWMDYTKPKLAAFTIEEYTRGLVQTAEAAYNSIQYDPDPQLGFEETERSFLRRRPSPQRLAWAMATPSAMRGTKPQTQPEVYAREQLLVEAAPERMLKLQALRVGTLAIAAWPNEVFAISGLKLKQKSPFLLTMNIALANGAEGYIPPPEQHSFGGYTTWLARTASLEEEAEPRMLAALHNLLIRFDLPVDRPRPKVALPAGAIASWPLDDLSLPETSSGLRLSGRFAYGVPGKDGPASRALYFAGGDLTISFPRQLASYEIDFWLWPGIQQTAHLLPQVELRAGILYLNGKRGSTNIPDRKWTRIIFRAGTTSQLLVNNKLELSIASAAISEDSTILGRGFEGRMAEIILRP